jgi:hypothetical protein
MKSGPHSARWLRSALAAIPVALVATILGALWERPRATTHADLASADFGFPLTWLHQSQSNLDPPFPVRMAPGSPWEHPTSFDWPSLAVDVSAYFLLVLVLWIAVSSVWTRTKSTNAETVHI